MAARRQQTHAKRARELALKERRERKAAKKAEVAAMRAAGIDPYAVDEDGNPVPHAELLAETAEEVAPEESGESRTA